MYLRPCSNVRSTPPPLSPPPPFCRPSRGWGYVGDQGHWTAPVIVLSHPSPHSEPQPISWHFRNGCTRGVRQPGLGNAVAWHKRTWRAGPKDRPSYWLHAGRETDQFGEYCSLAQRDMQDGWGDILLCDSKFKKFGQTSG